MPLRQTELDRILERFGGVDSYEILPLEEVDGFQGTYYNLRITSGGSTSSYFVKTVPEGSDVVNEFYRRSGTFLKEVGLYEKILPALNEYKATTLWPKCHTAAEGRYLVLEDMKDAGWKITKTMDFEHIKIALSGLANFHACSLSAQNDPEFCLLVESVLRETMFSEDVNHPGRQMWDSFCRFADDLLPRSGLLLRGVIDEVKPSKKFRNCLNHGDPWKNNMFFKYAQNRPVDVAFVDFQSARYAPPALDVAIFAHIVDPPNADKLARIYYQQLTPSLDETEFLESFDHYRRTGMAIAALYVFLTRLPEKYLSRVLVSQDTFIPFALGDYSPALKAIEEDLSYRKDVLCALQSVVDFHSISKNPNKIS